MPDDQIQFYHLKKVNAIDTCWNGSKYVFENITSSELIDNYEDDELSLIWSDCQWQNNQPDPKVIEAMIGHKNLENLMINYFPGASEVFRKDNLAENIRAMEDFYPGQFEGLIPKSWSLPQEYDKFVKCVRDPFCNRRHTVISIPNSRKNTHNDFSFNTICPLRRLLCFTLPESGPNQSDKCQECNNNQMNYYIVKPNDEQRGSGIYITSDPLKNLNNRSDVVVSKYIANPLLINGFKSDLRIHVLLISLDPLKIYIHKEGFLRLATEKYEKPNLFNSKNHYMHLTNVSVNQHNKEGIGRNGYKLAGQDFSVEESENSVVRSLTFLHDFLKKEGERIDTENYAKNGSFTNLHSDLQQQVWNDIKRIVFKTILASHQDLKTYYDADFRPTDNSDSASKAFQILGFDIMLDDNYKPWFIEINHNPDLEDDPALANIYARKLVRDSLEIVYREKFIKDKSNRILAMEKVSEEQTFSKFQDGENWFEEIDCQHFKEELVKRSDVVRQARESMTSLNSGSRKSSTRSIEALGTLVAKKPMRLENSVMKKSNSSNNLMGYRC